MATPYQIYLVGGAVRDELLGLKVIDRDWVVTGASPEQLLKEGFQQVGRQFPVFLHPKTKEEYALARTEKKQGSGYTGFICDFSPDISLEEDLKRRDLTINAIAKADNGNLIDPFGGQTDLQNKVFRHVSDAFTEDPLRVIRVARFMARFKELGFTVAPETLTLMRHISQTGELDSLSQERIWKELEKALSYSSPTMFFQILEECDAMQHVLPDLAWTEVKSLLSQSAAFSSLEEPILRWAYLCHQTSPEILALLQMRLTCPNQFKLYANLVSEFLHNTHLPLSVSDWHLWLNKLGAIKKPDIYKDMTTILSLLTQTNTSDWGQLSDAVNSVDISLLVKQGFQGAALGQAIQNEREANLASLNNALVRKQ